MRLHDDYDDDVPAPRLIEPPPARASHWMVSPSPNRPGVFIVWNAAAGVDPRGRGPLQVAFTGGAEACAVVVDGLNRRCAVARCGTAAPPW